MTHEFHKILVSTSPRWRNCTKHPFPQLDYGLMFPTPGQTVCISILQPQYKGAGRAMKSYGYRNSALQEGLSLIVFSCRHKAKCQISAGNTDSRTILTESGSKEFISNAQIAQRFIKIPSHGEADT
jgi:hypothetical protein